MKRITLILSIILLFSFLLPALTACEALTGTSEEPQSGITDEYIDYYFRLAKDYEQKAGEARAEADKYWGEYLSVQPESGYANQYEELANRNDMLADLYMQQAIYYHELTTQQ